jgi:hypothetical protein
VKEVTSKRRIERALLARLIEHVNRPSREFFFVDRPGDNRMRGRLDLVYDPWLYPVFESLGLAEPRSAWLARALAVGPVRVVVMNSNRNEIEGLPRTLTELGYRRQLRVGPFVVWIRAIDTPIDPDEIVISRAPAPHPDSPRDFRSRERTVTLVGHRERIQSVLRSVDRGWRQRPSDRPDPLVEGTVRLDRGAGRVHFGAASKVPIS